MAYVMYIFDAAGQKYRLVVVFDGLLCVVSKFMWWGRMWSMLWCAWWFVLTTCKQLVDVSWHADIAMSVVVVLYEGDATV